MANSIDDLREELERELEYACSALRGLTEYSQILERGYSEDEEESREKWEDVGTEEIVRMENSGCLAEVLKRAEKSKIPDTNISRLTELLQDMRDAVNDLSQYGKTLRSDEAREAIARKIREAHTALSLETRKWIKQELLDEIEFESEITRRKIARDKIRRIESQLSGAIDEARLSAQEAVWEMEKTIKERIQEKIPSQFSVEVKHARRRGYFWCLISLVLLAATGWVLWSLVVDLNIQSLHDIWSVVPAIVGKLALAGLAGYGIVWTARMGQACMHEAAVNLHRALSLVALENNVGADDSAELSRQLAREAAKAIYEPHDTGYIKGSDKRNRAESAVLQGLRGMIEDIKGQKE